MNQRPATTRHTLATDTPPINTPATTLNHAPLEIEVPPEAAAKIQRVRDHGVRIDELGLVIPSMSRTIANKICSDLIDIRQRVTQEIQNGKHVLYVPGSYDLLHAGHASWILDGIETYQRHHNDLSRENIFVVALCDDDELVRGVKPPHVVNSPGEHPRPIECNELFQHLTSKHPRLVDLATLPIDMVGFIPAPSTFGEVLNAPVFNSWLIHKITDVPQSISELDSSSAQELARVINLRDAIINKNFGEILASFQRAKFNLDYDPKRAAWDVVSWQTLMHLFIGDVYLQHSQQRFVRLISEHDVKYKDQVAILMDKCGIGHLFVNDVEVVSTTALVKKFGWETLAKRKLEYFQHIYDGLECLN